MACDRDIFTFLSLRFQLISLKFKPAAFRGVILHSSVNIYQSFLGTWRFHLLDERVGRVVK
jgi:hypothetical protein